LLTRYSRNAVRSASSAAAVPFQSLYWALALKYPVILRYLSDKKLGVRTGDVLRVVRTDKNRDIVHLTDGKKTIRLPLREHAKKDRPGFAVYKTGTVDLRVGLTIRWTEISKAYGIKTSELAHVEALDGRTVTLKMADGSSKTFSLNDPALRHIDYGYAIIANSGQGKTSDYTIGVFDSHARFTTNQRNYYVTISRARHLTTLHVDDAKKTVDRIRQTTGAKLSALEAIDDRKTWQDFSMFKHGPDQAHGAHIEKQPDTTPVLDRVR